jgi:hypothetical protein
VCISLAKHLVILAVITNIKLRILKIDVKQIKVYAVLKNFLISRAFIWNCRVKLRVLVVIRGLLHICHELINLALHLNEISHLLGTDADSESYESQLSSADIINQIRCVFPNAMHQGWNCRMLLKDRIHSLLDIFKGAGREAYSPVDRFEEL